MDTKKHSTRVRLTAEQLSGLKRLAQQTKVPIEDYIREGIDLVLERHQHLPGQIPLLIEIGQDSLDRPPTH